MMTGTPDPGSHDLSKLDHLLINLHANLTMGLKMFLALREEVEAVKTSEASLRQQMEHLTEDNSKLQVMANENAQFSQFVQEKKKTLKAENQSLRKKLADLQKQWSGCKDQQSSPSDQGHDDLEEDITEIGISEEHPKERKSSKLSLPRNKSKIRYQVIPSVQTTSPPFIPNKPSEESRGSDGCALSETHRSANNPPFIPHKPSEESRGSDGCALSETHQSANKPDQGRKGSSGCAMNSRSKENSHPATEVVSGHSSSDYSRKLKGGSEIRQTTGNVLVPDTEMVKDDSDDPDVDDQLEDNNQNHFKTEDYHSVVHVPETMQPDSEMFSPIQSDSRSQGCALQRRTDQNYSGNLIPLEQSTPMLDGPSDITSRILQDKGRSASPLLLKATRDKSRRSIPPSESQLLVDFSRTQMSPTFDGAEGRSTPDRPSSVKHRYSGVSMSNDSSTPRQTKEKKKPIIWAISSRSEASPSVSTDPKTPNLSMDSVRTTTSPAFDESGQLETSFLILQHPSQPKSKSQTVQSSGQRSGHSRGMESKHDSESRPKRRLSDGAANIEVNSTKRKKTVSSDADEQEDNFDEQFIPDQDVGNQRHILEERGQSMSECFPGERSSHTGNLDVKPALSNTAKISKKGKQLVQMRLTKDSFKSTVSPSHQMQRKFNGGHRVYVDSQDDPYIQKALRESMQMAGVQDQPSQDGASTDFKVPMIPKSLHVSGKVKDVQHHISDDGLERDLNGSIDPAIELSFLDDSTAVEIDGNKENRGQTDTRGDVSGSSRRSEAVGNRKTSSEHRAGGQWRSFDGNDGGEPTFMDDSIADMFEDEDESTSIDKGQSKGHGHEDQNMEGSGLEKQIKSEAVEDHFDKEARNDMHEGMDQDENTLARHFDNLPKKDEPPAYKFKDVVRKRDERQKLKGFDCQECAGYYGGLGLTADEIALRTKNCSRHRGHYSPPSTPEHYWSIDFPDTETCIQRGYIQDPGAVEEELVPRRKRKMRYRHNFGKTKEDGPS